ncbi:MAG: hypothetical protein J6B67_01270 [Oscillospiraceae bacterium]|nr:hypothetical protein [Oscillospiraceae bacterium]
MGKKEKTTYVDDGRTLADMSGVSGGFRLTRDPYRQGPKFKDAWSTYWSAVKKMFLPMLAVIGALVIIYAILYILFAFVA